MPNDVAPCGWISDGGFVGIARCWSTGEPSLPVALITRYWIAGPGAVPEEIEKAGTSRFIGQVHDALLAFREKETACRLHDPYVQAPCKVSNISWLMATNPPDGLSGQLWDRCRITQFPEPRRVHLPMLARQIIIYILSEHGLEPCQARAFNAAKLEAIASVWPGGSLRSLRRMIEVAVASGSVRH
jgi:ATP-dependent Lon protease